MWKLVRLSLAYHLKALILTWIVALLLSKAGLVMAAIVGALLLYAEDGERRLLLHLRLPVTRTQVGWARVLFPAVVLALPAAIAVLLSAAAAPLLGASLGGGGVEWTSGVVRQQLVFAGVAMMLLQLVLAVLELNRWASRQGLRRLLTGTVLLASLLGLTLLAWGALAYVGSGPVIALGAAALTLGLMGLSVLLFQQRPSFTSG